MFNKFELIGGAASIFFMGLAIYLLSAQSIFHDSGQTAQVIESKPGIIIVDQSANVTEARTNAYLEASDNRGNIKNMVIDDIKIGVGEEVKDGDVVAVHYKGSLQNGEEFDNSHKRGSTFDFKVGSGQVIKGWDEGLIGMKVGGQRILVIPPEMAYGDSGVGPIPGGATLVFTIELISIK